MTARLLQALTIFCYAAAIAAMLVAMTTPERWPLVFSSIIGLVGMGCGLTGIAASNPRR